MMPAHKRGVSRGFSMIEVLVSLFVLLVGLLGAAGVMLQSQRAEFESYQRVQAMILLQDMVSRINANRYVAPCYAITDGITGLPFLGAASTVTPACTTAVAPAATTDRIDTAVEDMTEWSDLLLGKAEFSGSNNFGAMIGARGCISLDPATNVYTISIAWQGLGNTLAPSAGLPCAKDQFDEAASRRVVSTTLEFGNLSGL